MHYCKMLKGSPAVQPLDWTNSKNNCITYFTIPHVMCFVVLVYIASHEQHR